MKDVQPLLKRRYRIVSLVGRGGMGAVYKAADIELGNRLVAVKEMILRGLNAREVAWSPDGEYIASGGADTIVHIWRAL